MILHRTLRCTGIAVLCCLTASPASAPAGASALGTGWQDRAQVANRSALVHAVDNSLRYLQSSAANASYRRSKASTGISRLRVRRSLLRFRQLLLSSHDPTALHAALKREFVCYQSRGQNNDRVVAFTGYYEPIYDASHVRTAAFRYPLYGVPRFSRAGTMPRLRLEGADGLHPAPEIRGRELVWLRDRLQAYLVQVEGSARLRLPDGHLMSVTYASHNTYPYTSMGRELVKDGKLTFAALTQQALIQYFKLHPEQLDSYLPRNRRFVFFRETRGAPTSGSLGVPLTPEHSIATDKAWMPPGALALIMVHLKNPTAVRILGQSTLTRFVLDQDAGDAIKGASRVDVYMGTGDRAGDRSGVINASGELYYLLLKENSAAVSGAVLVPAPFPEW